MKKSLLLAAGMFAFAAAAQEATEPTFVAEELDGKTITLTCASGNGQGYFMTINGTSLTAAADPGSNPYKWVVEYDPEEQGMILSAGGYYIGRVPDSATDANAKYFTLTQDKELAGRYRFYSPAEGLYCLTATKFVNGTTNETISEFGAETSATANHWMQCDTSGSTVHITRWGSRADNSKWTYTVVDPKPQYLPVTMANQIVDGGKYVIAGYNHSWGTANHADKRFLKFSNNEIVIAETADATAESVTWTAHNSSAFTCNSTGHTHGIDVAKIVTFSHDDGNGVDRYMKFDLDVDGSTTSTTNTDPDNVFEVIQAPTPNGGAAGNSYFYIHSKYSDTNTFFNKSVMVTGSKVLGIGSLSGQSNTNNYYNTTNNKNTTRFLLWRVIETEGDLYSHANEFLFACRSNDIVFAPGFGNYNLAGNTDVSEPINAIVAGMEGSNAAVSTVDINAYLAASTGTIQRNVTLPEPGSYLTIKGEASGFHNQHVIYYNTYTGTSTCSQNQCTDIRFADGTNTPNLSAYNPNDAILYYDNDNLLSYTSGYYLGIKDSHVRWLQESDLTETGGNEGAPIYIVRRSNVWNVLQMNGVINGSPVALVGGTSGAKWTLAHQTYSGQNAEYAKTGISTATYAPWEVALVRELPVELGTDGYGSFYAPVAVSFHDENVTVRAAEVTDTDIHFTTVNTGTVIAPGTPVILEGTPDTTVEAFIDYNYQPAAVLAETAAPAISFYGKSAVEKLTAEEGVCTFKPTAGENGTVTMTKVDANSTLPVNTMLMSMPEDCPLISEDGTVTLKLNGSNSTTGIREIGADKADGANGAIYDLQGRRLGAPVKGINIIGGRKVLVK